MSLLTFVFILLLANVKSDNFFNKNVNFHKNDDDFSVSNKRVYSRPLRILKRLKLEKIPSLDSEEDSNLDKMNFHYPQVEFLTKRSSLESEYGEMIPMHSGLSFQGHVRRPRKFSKLKQPERNLTIYYEPIPYVEKISKPEENELSKYAEISTEISEQSKSINDLLKNYLDKLYSKKYSDDKNSSIKEDSPETKLFPINSLGLNGKKEKINNIKKLFSLFTIVQFNNTECNATGDSLSYLGLCYTEAECTKLGGTSVGNCANGYGVCCVFKGSCGESAKQNCSYFESPNYPDYYPAGGDVIIPSTVAPPDTTENPSPTPDPRLYWSFVNYNKARQSDDPTLSCIFSVYKLNDNIRKMKIDFLDLELAGPTDGTCETERLVITGQSANSIVPPICGYNTGQSIYVDVSQSTGPLKLMILASMQYRKRFRIMICQYSDLSSLDNCLQAYTGVTGTISSFNYDQVSMFNRSVPGYFNNLNYAICIQKEAGYCSITYTNENNGVEYPFSLANFVNGVSTVPSGVAGIDVIDCPDDYIVIDGVRLCGYKFNDGSTISNLSINSVVTDNSAGPIVISVRTNEADAGYGFRLFYTQNRC